MSYILDALRRADAERERGEVPGLQSQQHAALDDDDAAPRARPLVWAVVALAIALVVAIAWNWLGGEPPRAVAPSGIAGTPPGIAPIAAAPVAPVASTAPAAPVATPSAPTSPAVAAVERRPPPRRVAKAPAAIAAASGASARAAVDSRVYAMAELPEAVRREMPKLAFGGSSYSGSASSRMVILNGQVFHEGDTVAPGLTLRQIKPKAAVLSFRDYRFEMSY
ncbi:MAG: general secretion pathway protein GspB [Caldimonas sp.]